MDIRKEITLSAMTYTEQNEPIMAFNGSINTGDPNALSYTASVMNQALYRKNREKAKADQSEFENALYAEQDAMITTVQKMTEETK